MKFDNPNSTEKEAEAISAVKALQIATQQGQKIFTINQTNLGTVLPQLSHKATVMQDVKDAVAAGKIVTISQRTVSYQGWTGTGYIVTDPNTGAGAYLIGGGADGSFAKYLPRFDSMASAMYWSGVSLGISISAITPLLQAGGVMGVAIGALIIAPILITIGAMIRHGKSDQEKACFLGGIADGGMPSSFLIASVNHAVKKGLIKYFTKAIGEGTEGATLALSGLNLLIFWPIGHWTPGSEGASCD